jgi:hypothetical protein
MLEKIAEVQHEIWSHWMKYLFEVTKQNEDGSVTIPADKVKRWKRQLSTKFADLSEKEKESDIEQALKVLKVINDSSQSGI